MALLLALIFCSLFAHVVAWSSPWDYYEVDEHGFWKKPGPSAGGSGLKPPPREDLTPGTLRSEAQGFRLKGDGARCLDGTDPMYFHRLGFGSGVKKWLIHHQGGGWCQSYNCTEAPCPGDSCYVRSGGALGSTKNDRDLMLLKGGYFDVDPEKNPTFYNWNMLFLRYCDGGSFSGNRVEPVQVGDKKLYFHGFNILNAMIDHALHERGMASATDVVVSGCSAGGLATFLHVDHWAARVQEVAPEAVVVGMPDSGFFLDFEEERRKFHTGLTFVFDAMNASAGVDQDCIAANPKETWRCIFAQYTSPYIQTPMFALQPRFDSWQTDMILNSEDPGEINKWGNNVWKLISDELLAHNPRHMVFLDSCHHHCGSWGSLIDATGRTQPKVFHEWYRNITRGQPITQQMRARLQPYPCDICCTPMYFDYWEMGVLTSLGVVVTVATLSVIVLGKNLVQMWCVFFRVTHRSRSALGLVSADEEHLVSTKKDGGRFAEAAERVSLLKDDSEGRLLHRNNSVGDFELQDKAGH